MRWNIAAECISAVMLSIIWAYSRKGSIVPTLKNKMFQACFLTTFCAMISNILSTVMLANPQAVPAFLTEAVTLVYFAATPLMGMAYFFYAAATVYEKHDGVWKVIGWMSVPGILYFLMVLGNPFMHLLFIIQPGGGYAQGPLILLTYLIFYFYCLCALVLVLMKRAWLERPIRRILASFPVIACAVIVFQQFYPEIILTGSAATSALLLIYLYLQNKQIAIDYLTGLPNHHAFIKMLELQIKKNSQQPFTVIVLSLRDFKLINDTFGQQSGDAFLHVIAEYLRSVCPARSVYRFSGDEFALFVPGEGEPARRLALVLQERMHLPWQAKEYACILQAVVGVVRYPDSSDSAEGLVNGIEYAVARAKAGFGDDAVCYCGPEMFREIKRRSQITSILEEKLKTGEFEVYYQPIFSVKSGKYVCAEALMRIPESPLGPIYPNEFIPLAEESGMIIGLTYQILEKVCCFISRLTELHIPFRCINVNFSAVQFTQQDLIEKTLAVLRENNTPASKIKIEFTESVLAENQTAVAHFAEEMRKKGILLGLDDFGTGYSNIVSVINTPFDTVKLDKSLIWSAMESRRSASMIKNMTSIFHELGLKVLAEGVETQEQDAFVRECGIDMIQGFLYARPMPEKEALRFCAEQAALLERYGQKDPVIARMT